MEFYGGISYPNQDQSWSACGAQADPPTHFRGAPPGDRQWAPIGQEKTLGCLKEQFYWPGHFSDVHNWCESCVSCTTRKTPALG